MWALSSELKFSKYMLNISRSNVFGKNFLIAIYWVHFPSMPLSQKTVFKMSAIIENIWYEWNQSMFSVIDTKLPPKIKYKILWCVVGRKSKTLFLKLQVSLTTTGPRHSVRAQCSVSSGLYDVSGLVIQKPEESWDIDKKFTHEYNPFFLQI